MRRKKKCLTADKKIAQRIHAKQRAEERYGVTLNRHDMRDLVDQIQNRRAVFLGAQSLRVSVFAIRLKNLFVPVVYDKARKTIVTFLPTTGNEYSGRLALLNTERTSNEQG